MTERSPAARHNYDIAITVVYSKDVGKKVTARPDSLHLSSYYYIKSLLGHRNVIFTIHYWNSKEPSGQQLCLPCRMSGVERSLGSGTGVSAAATVSVVVRENRYHKRKQSPPTGSARSGDPIRHSVEGPV